MAERVWDVEHPPVPHGEEYDENESDPSPEKAPFHRYNHILNLLEYPKLSWELASMLPGWFQIAYHQHLVLSLLSDIDLSLNFSNNNDNSVVVTSTAPLLSNGFDVVNDEFNKVLFDKLFRFYIKSLKLPRYPARG